MSRERARATGAVWPGCGPPKVYESTTSARAVFVCREGVREGGGTQVRVRESI
jgi:hypothetical protein